MINSFRAKTSNTRKRFIPLGIAALLTLFIITHGHAQIAPEPCDENYYQSLEARAWLEAEREVMQNQNLIFKPDSVMEYTCFDRYLGELADHAKDMLSENPTKWGPILPITSMDGALTRLVGTALQVWVSQNFSHTYLGGRSGQDGQVIGSIIGGTYICLEMNRIWQEAKCMNFIDEANQDGFYTFEEYARNKNDVRLLPSACTAAIAWQNNIDLAYGASTPWTEDDVNTYEAFLEPGLCAQPPPTDNPDLLPLWQSGIETGITVIRQSAAPYRYEEKVCIQPGCYYVPAGPTTGTCEPSPYVP